MGKILIVDDSSLIRNVASEAITAAGHTPIIASNGQEGLEKVMNETVDLIFSDVNMPIMGGMEMVEKIKEMSEFKFLPIVMLTTESSPELKEKGKALGAKAWLVKPFDKDKFTTVVKKLLG
ncbi:MAG: response regulator [Sulfurimonas sp.]|nr:MAG: response regulator [Sulfurimonas sp.]